MARPISKVAPGWWDYTTLDSSLLADAAQAYAERSFAAVAARLRSRDLRHDRRVLLCRSAGIHPRLAAGDGRQSGRHLRPDRADGAVAACGAHRERARHQAAQCALLGHGRVDRKRSGRADRSSAFVCEGRHGVVLQSHSAGTSDAEEEHSFSDRISKRIRTATTKCAAC